MPVQIYLNIFHSFSQILGTVETLPEPEDEDEKGFVKLLSKKNKRIRSRTVWCTSPKVYESSTGQDFDTAFL